jgi:hypothetical protein
MVAPPLLILPTDADYRQHYEQHYCRAVIMTHDAIRVFFRPDRFSHAFYESPLRDGIKAKILSPDRAQRMNWIAATLTNPAADRFQGWDRDNARYEAIRCVSVVWEDSRPTRRRRPSLPTGKWSSRARSPPCGTG